MAFSTDISAIINKKWSMSNTYQVQISFSSEMGKLIGWVDDVEGRDINQHIVSINTPDFSNSPIEVYIGGQYRIHNGKDELYRFSITFRDYDMMYLYRKFLTAYRSQAGWYFDDACSIINIIKEADYEGEVNTELMTLNDCFIEGISNLDINNNNEAQVSEFTVKFKSMSPVIKK